MSTDNAAGTPTPSKPKIARSAYNGYCQCSDYKSPISGATLPPFDDLPPEIQTAWQQAAIGAVLESPAFKVTSKMIEAFPGLWDGNNEVNGADLVDFLTERLAEEYKR